MQSVEDEKRPKARGSGQDPQAEVVIKQESPGPDDFPLLLQNTQCPDCIGDERLPLEERKFKYYRPNVRNDHWDDTYTPKGKGACRTAGPGPRCVSIPSVFVLEDVRLESLDHFRNHVATIHRVPLRTSDKVALRRAEKAKRRGRHC